MRIALLGGTGDIGQGLALRLAHDTDHDIIIGSREVEKSERTADEYESALASRGQDVSLEGLANPDSSES